MADNSYKVGGCSKATFDRLVSEHKLVPRKVYFVADRNTTESGLLTTDETGMLYIATSDRTYMKASDSSSAEEKYIVQQYTDGSQLQKLFTLSRNGSVIIDVVCSVNGRVWSDTLYYSETDYASTGYFYTNYHRVFIEARYSESVSGAVCIETKKSTLAPSMRMYLRVVKLEGTITWHENEYRNAGQKDVVCDKVSASVDLTNATNLTTDSEGEITNEIGESVAALADNILYTINASASGGDFTIPTRVNYSGTKIYCFGSGTATMNGNTLSYENGNTIVLEGGSMTIETADKDYYTKEESDERYELKGRPADKVFTIQNDVTDYRSFYFARWKRYDYPDPNEQSVSYNSVRKFHVRVTKAVEEYSSPIVTDVTFLYCGYSAMSIGNTGRGGTYLIIDGVPVNTDATGNEGTFYYGDIAVYNGHYVSEDNTSYNYLGFVTYQDSELPQPRTDRMKVEIWDDGYYITDGKDDGFEWLDGQVHTHEDGYPWSLQQLSNVCEYAYWNLRTVENTNNKSWSIASDSPDETYPTCRGVYNFVTGLLSNKTEYWEIEFYTYSRQVIAVPAEMAHFIIKQSYGANSIVDITNIGTYTGKVLEFLNLNGNSYKIKIDAETEIDIGGGFTMSKVLVVFKSNAWHIYKVAELTELTT